MNRLEMKLLQGKEALLQAFPVFQQLRPFVHDAEAFLAQVARQEKQGYQLLAAWQGPEIVGLAGYRELENFIYGKFVYIDDLVVLAQSRRLGVGEQLIHSVRQYAQQQGCQHLILDTALNNALAQRFYFRQGLVSNSLGFSQVL